jgi:phosphate transport system substrate-binding protein
VASSGGDLTGAGASFPYPLYSKWTAAYQEKTGQQINYQPSGSGAGIRQLSEGTVDFGGSDGPMSDAELAAAKHGPILHIPTTIGAVVVIYNLPGVTQPLRMTPDVVADIFLRRITKWNDPRLAAANPGVALPARDILVAHRSDGSGTTFIFTDYLSKVSPTWAAGPGAGKSVSWPAGTMGGKANEGVAAQVQQTDGAIGYVELAYATQNRLAVAVIQNAAGNFVAPTVESITAAAAGVADTLSATSDYRISIANSPGQNAYPIASFTWILIYQNPPDAQKAKSLVDFLEWGVTDGQQYAAALHYAPLPASMIAGIRSKLASVSVGTK